MYSLLYSDDEVLLILICYMSHGYDWFWNQSERKRIVVRMRLVKLKRSVLFVLTERELRGKLPYLGICKNNVSWLLDRKLTALAPTQEHKQR